MNIYPKTAIRHNATNQSTHLNRFKGGFHFLFSGRVKPGVCYHLVKLGRPSECSGRNCSLDVVTSVSAWTRHRKMTSHLSHFQWYDVQLWVGVRPHFSRSGLTVVKEEAFIFVRDSYEFSLAACHRHREEVHWVVSSKECASMAKNGGLWKAWDAQVVNGPGFPHSLMMNLNDTKMPNLQLPLFIASNPVKFNSLICFHFPTGICWVTARVPLDSLCLRVSLMGMGHPAKILSKAPGAFDRIEIKMLSRHLSWGKNFWDIPERYFFLYWNL